MSDPNRSMLRRSMLRPQGMYDMFLYYNHHPAAITSITKQPTCWCKMLWCPLPVQIVPLNVIGAGIFLMETSEILWSSYRPCSQSWHLCVTYVEWFVHYLWLMTGFPLLVVNRDGCYMWGRKCSLFPEHLISLPLGSSWLHPFIIYTWYITEFVSFRTMFMD